MFPITKQAVLRGKKRALFDARSVAGSATHKQSKALWALSFKQKSVNQDRSLPKTTWYPSEHTVNRLETPSCDMRTPLSSITCHVF